MIRRVMSLLAALGAVVATIVVLPATTAAAADCAPAWNSSSVYTGGGSASYNGHNWSAKWWTQNEKPGTSDVWADKGSCGSGGTDPGSPTRRASSSASRSSTRCSRTGTRSTPTAA